MGIKEVLSDILRLFILKIAFYADPFTIITLSRAKRILLTSSGTKDNLPGYVNKNKTVLFPQFGITYENELLLPKKNNDHKINILFAGKHVHTRERVLRLRLNLLLCLMQKYPDTCTFNILIPPDYKKMFYKRIAKFKK